MPEGITWMEFFTYEDRKYIGYPPMASLILVPYAAVGGAALGQTVFNSGLIDPPEARESYRALCSLLGQGPEVGEVSNRSIPGPNGEIPMRIYWPVGSAERGVTVFFHGGGWVIDHALGEHFPHELDVDPVGDPTR